MRRRDEIRQARDEGEDWDADEFLTLQSRIDMLGHQIRELGGSLDPPAPTPATTGGKTPPAPKPTPKPAPADPVAQAEAKVKELRGSEPHPGVRLGPDNKVVGGTPEQLRENLEWRTELAKAEEDLALAQGERAFDAGGGLDGFTPADRAQLDQKRKELDRLRAEDERVKGEIEPLERQLEDARRQLDANRGQTGGPNAAGAGAIGAGAAVNQRLKPLYEEQARIRARIAQIEREIAELAKARIRSRIDRGGGTGAIDLPPDRNGKHRVETELLRRILERLGIKGVNADGTGMLARPHRTGRRAASLSPVSLMVIAIFLLGVIALAGVLLLRGDDTTPVAASDTTTTTSRAGVTTSNPPADEGDEYTTEPVAPVDGPASTVAIAVACPQVVHSPPPGGGSLSKIELGIMFVGFDGLIPDGAEVAVDLGGDAPGSTMIDDGLAQPVIGISSYGTYMPESVTVTADGRLLEVVGSLPAVEVGPGEGPVGGCTPPNELSSEAREAAAELALGTHRVAEFVQQFDVAHDARDATQLLEWLDPASIDRYGEEACAAYLDETVGTLDDLTIISAQPEEWSYDTDALSLPIDGSWTVNLDLTQGGTRAVTEMHVRLAGSITWFTDCGDPIGP